VPSPRNAPTRPSASIASAAQRARSVIEDLQSKLSEAAEQGARPAAGAQSLAAGRVERVADSVESEADLERQLAAYFAHETAQPATSGGAVEEMRRRVIDGVVDRILRDWSKPGARSALQEQVLERLIQRVLLQFGSSAESGKTQASIAPNI